MVGKGGISQYFVFVYEVDFDFFCVSRLVCGNDHIGLYIWGLPGRFILAYKGNHDSMRYIICCVGGYFLLHIVKTDVSGISGRSIV